MAIAYIFNQLIFTMATYHKVNEYNYRLAYCVPYANAQSLEIIEDMEDHIEAAKQGLLWLGF